MKLAFLAPEFYNIWSSVGIYTIGLIRQLSRLEDLEIHVLCSDVKDVKAKEALQKTLGESVHIHPICMVTEGYIYNLKFQLAVLREFKGLHERFEFDIIHAADLVHMPDLFIKMSSIDIPILTTAHATVVGHVSSLLRSNWNPFSMARHERLDLLIYPIMRLLEKYYLRKSRHIITISKTSMENLKTRYNFKGDVRVISNSIDASYLNLHTVTPKVCVQRFPAIKNIRDPIILYAGRISAQKGLIFLLKSLKRLADEGERFDLIVAGKGGEDLLNKGIESTGINPKSVHFFGFLNNQDLACLYSTAEIFVLPSFYEEFPIGLLEAMSMECCPVATDVGEIAEIIDHEENGLVVRPGDIKAMADSLKFLLNNRKIAKRWAKAGRLKVNEFYTADQMAVKTKIYYDEILGRS